MLLHKDATSTKVEAMQLFSFFSFFFGSWQVGGKVGRAGGYRQGCRCDISIAVTPLSRQHESSSVHVIQDVSVHHLVLLLDAWMIFVHCNQKILAL